MFALKTKTAAPNALQSSVPTSIAAGAVIRLVAKVITRRRLVRHRARDELAKVGAAAANGPFLTKRE